MAASFNQGLFNFQCGTSKNQTAAALFRNFNNLPANYARGHQIGDTHYHTNQKQHKP